MVDWYTGIVYDITDDIDLEDIQNICPSISIETIFYKNNEKGKKPTQIPLDFIRHGSLLYTYRNSLVHELRQKGQGMNIIKNAEQPYYQIMDTVVPETLETGMRILRKQTLELVYPLNLFKTLCEDAIKNVKNTISIIISTHIHALI